MSFLSKRGVGAREDAVKLLQVKGFSSQGPSPKATDHFKGLCSRLKPAQRSAFHVKTHAVHALTLSHLTSTSTEVVFREPESNSQVVKLSLKPDRQTGSSALWYPTVGINPGEGPRWQKAL